MLWASLALFLKTTFAPWGMQRESALDTPKWKRWKGGPKRPGINVRWNNSTYFGVISYFTPVQTPFIYFFFKFIFGHLKGVEKL